MCRWLLEWLGRCDRLGSVSRLSFFCSKSGDRSGSSLKAIALHPQSLNPIPIEDYRLHKIAEKAYGF